MAKKKSQRELDREAFERHMTAINRDSRVLQRVADGRYMSMYTQTAWHRWQAALRYARRKKDG